MTAGESSRLRRTEQRVALAEATQRAQTAESKLALVEASHRITQAREVAAMLEQDSLREAVRELTHKLRNREQRLERLREAHMKRHDKYLVLQQKLTAIERCL